MRSEIILSPETVADLKRLDARSRAAVRDALEKYLRHSPDHASKSRIKRLSGTSKPRYRRRVGILRVYYDVAKTEVEVLAVVSKRDANRWLGDFGEFE